MDRNNLLYVGIALGLVLGIVASAAVIATAQTIELEHKVFLPKIEHGDSRPTLTPMPTLRPTLTPVSRENG